MTQTVARPRVQCSPEVPMKTMTLRSLALLTLLVTNSVQAAPPANDKFENAAPLAPGLKLLNQNGSKSTPDALDPFIGGVKLARSVWYRYDPPFSGLARVVIDDHTGVRAGVFLLADPDGNAGTLTFQAQTNNTAGNDVDTLVFYAAATQRYYICVEGNGLFDLKLRHSTVDNDDFDNATDFGADQGSYSATNIGATDTDDVPTVVPDEKPQQGVWYKWTPTFTGTAVVDTNFSEVAPGVAFDSRLAVFTGTTLANLVNVASDNDSGYLTNSRVVFNATAGTTYRIWVGGAVQNIVGNFNISFFPATSPGVFELDTSGTSTTEDQGGMSVRVRRWRAGNVAAAVNLKTNAETATVVTDFANINVTPNFPSGATGNDNSFESTATLTLVNDVSPEASETLSLALSAPTNGATLGTSTPRQITILDQLFPVTGGFTSPILVVKESDGELVIPIVRDTAVGVAQTIITPSINGPGTALENVDYQQTGQFINFNPGQTLAFLKITLKNDGVFEGNETIILRARSSNINHGITGEDNLVITVVDDDLPTPVAGRLAAVLDTNDPLIAGTVDISISATGSVTGKVAMSRGVLPFKGTLVDGRLTVRLGTPTSPVRTLSILLLNAPEKRYLVSLADGVLGTGISTEIVATSYSKLTPCPVAGYYTAADGGAAGIPQLMAVSIKVDAVGTAVVAGKAFDGTPVVASGAVDASNIAWVGTSLYAGKGRAAVGAILSTTPQTLNQASFVLTRPGRSNQNVELPFVDAIASGAVGRYIPPAKGQRALVTWNPNGVANLELASGGFGAPLVKPVTISTANKVSINIPASDAAKITLTPATGFFSGSVLPPGATSAKPIYGVMLQGGLANSGCYGFFLNGIVPGRARVF